LQGKARKILMKGKTTRTECCVLIIWRFGPFIWRNELDYELLVTLFRWGWRGGLVECAWGMS
jgi:hypothetical protein